MKVQSEALPGTLEVAQEDRLVPLHGHLDLLDVGANLGILLIPREV